MVCTEEFKDGEAEWYLPSAENGMMRYIRVLITTKDEATLFVSFSDPYKPECMIKNSTPEVLEYKQSGAKRRQVIQPFTSVPFVWDDLVSTKKKQLKIYTNKEKQEFSIDDIKQIGEIKSKTDKYSIFVKAKKDFKQISIRSEQKAKDADKNAKPINPLQILLMERMNLKRLSVSVEVKGIQVSIIDSDPKEVLLLSLHKLSIHYDKKSGFNGLGTIYLVNINTETLETVDVTVDHCQIDNMASSQNPVIFCPKKLFKKDSEESKEADEEYTPFIQLKIDKQSLMRKKEIHVRYP